jgi:hypothetical protein
MSHRRSTVAELSGETSFHLLTIARAIEVVRLTRVLLSVRHQRGLVLRRLLGMLKCGELTLLVHRCGGRRRTRKPCLRTDGDELSSGLLILRNLLLPFVSHVNLIGHAYTYTKVMSAHLHPRPVDDLLASPTVSFLLVLRIHLWLLNDISIRNCGQYQVRTAYHSARGVERLNIFCCPPTLRPIHVIFAVAFVRAHINGGRFGWLRQKSDIEKQRSSR